MNKKALKYTIILLLIPLMASLIIAILTNNMSTDSSYNSNSSSAFTDGEIPSFDNKTKVEEIKSTSTYAYISVFTLCVASGVILMYVKKKRGI
jgi:hypothetical protein